MLKSDFYDEQEQVINRSPTKTEIDIVLNGNEFNRLKSTHELKLIFQSWFSVYFLHNLFMAAVERSALAMFYVFHNHSTSELQEHLDMDAVEAHIDTLIVVGIVGVFIGIALCGCTFVRRFVRTQKKGRAGKII